MKKRDGSPIFVSTTSHFFSDESGKLLGIEGIFRDISDRKRADENLHHKTGELQAAYEQLAVAEGELRENYHELSRTRQALTQTRKKLNLLNTVTFQDLQNEVFSLLGYLQLNRHLQAGEKDHLCIEKEQTVVRRLLKNLDFAKTYQNLGINPPRWQNVQQIFLFAVSHLDLSKIVGKVDLDGQDIYADPLPEKVFYPLAENVLVHSKSTTEICLANEEKPEDLKIIFADNGEGIPDSEKLKVLLKGYGDRKRMGLFLAREILELTGFTLNETGEDERGARFEIMVPKGAFRFTNNSRVRGGKVRDLLQKWGNLNQEGARPHDEIISCHHGCPILRSTS
jgi:K+-sensing histidine kinase KdpD